MYHLQADWDLEDDDTPSPHDALTVDEAIARLQAIRQAYGGETRLVMADDEPVVQLAVAVYVPAKQAVLAILRDEAEPPAEARVVVTDRF